MTRWIRYALAALVVNGLGIACSSTGTGGGTGQPTAACGDGANDCRPWDCFCNDGASTGGSACVFGTCQSGAELCADRCADHGGVTRFEPRQAVEDSAECAAYCNRIQSQCGADARCNVWFWCAIRAGECAESVRDHLACEAETMQVTCTDNGWSSSSGCPHRTELCAPAADAGSDA
jgi:hypothetical protein